MALKLKVAKVGDLDRDMLVKMQPYIATLPHRLRCPCADGIELAKFELQFLGCAAVPALGLKEKLLEEVDAGKTQLDLRSERIERNGQESKTLGMNFQGPWDRAILTHCPRDFWWRMEIPRTSL